MSDFQPLWSRQASPFQGRAKRAEGFRAGFGALNARVITADSPAQPDTGVTDHDPDAPQPQQQQEAQAYSRLDLEEALEAAREEGLAAGREEVLAELEPRLLELQAHLAQVGPLLDALQLARAEALQEAASQVGDLVMGLCRRVLGPHLRGDPQAIGALVEQAVARFPQEDELVIHVPPEAHESVQSMFPSRRVVADSTVEAGCRVNARYTSLEVSLATVLEGVEHAVEGWLESRP